MKKCISGLLICGVLIALIIAAFLYGSLEGNRLLWLARKPAAYQYNYWNPDSGVRIDPRARQVMVITVVGDKVISARRVDNGAYHPSPETFPTIDMIFEWVAEAKSGTEQQVDITFDPKFRFPNFVNIGQIEVDSGYQYVLTEFKAVDEQNQ